MAGGYARVNPQDDDDHHESKPVEATPNSPPPSFRSRASSTTRNRQVNADLEDAFGSDDDESDDETDDRQRLVSQTTPTTTTPPSSTSSTTQQRYAPVPSTPVGRVIGGGSGSDGVFANMSARPERTNGASEKDEQPPTYEQAAADQAPPYWETSILVPGLGGYDEVFVDGMPVGSVFSFAWNGMISTSFQFVGFLLTYLLHSTHAAKNGSRAGLGLTMIQYGFTIRDDLDSETPGAHGPDGYAAPKDPNSHNLDAADAAGSAYDQISVEEWFSYVLMVAGWFILIKSVADFLQARKTEQLIMESPSRGLNVPIIADGESSEHVV
ncbi:hypothetical protein VHEMI03031 [[Torrubiella] hemipterigena]|uniref:Metal homeostatis protein bsd2 n=1 Tax=[Torrubiella] hemipterigena TaxID=1531966 RepID=A0A0A1T9W7_9HYPO|nr:hypothetical protein VHEMI03031 [[Torrubiella] hemipterigena]